MHGDLTCLFPGACLISSLETQKPGVTRFSVTRLDCDAKSATMRQRCGERCYLVKLSDAATVQE
jgi:hypothetical protein